MTETLPDKRHRFTVAEYQRMGETGILPVKARIELLDGEIIDMSPIGNLHCAIVARLVRLFNKRCNDRWLLWVQSSLPLDEHSEPQPDLALLKPSPHDYAAQPPAPEDVLLLLEVADSSLQFDRQKKLPLYGRAGVSEVWIINLLDRTIEVYREPNFTGYAKPAILRAGDKASPLAFHDVTVDVAELLKTA